MAGFTIKVDNSDVLKAIGRFASNDLPIVTAYALTKTGQDIKAREYSEMVIVFDRPSRFALNALYLKPATKTDQVAVVEFKEGFGSIPAWRFLGPQVQGGGRSKKSHERALERAGILRPDEYVVPGEGVKLDANGNMPGGEITKILSQLQAAETSAGFQANMTGKSKKRNVKRNGRYFVLRGTRAPDGVYWRKGVKDIVPVMVFVKAPKYQPRFHFYDLAVSTFDANFVRHARDGFARFVASKG